MPSQKVSLVINDFNVSIAEFVQDFIRNVVTGMLSTLKGIDEIRSVDLSFHGDEVEIKVNDTAVPAKDFVNDFIRSTVTGMVTSLKGVDRVDSLAISIR